MTIKFTTTDGRTVETTDKNVLFETARKGEITPETLVEVNGKTYLAKKIKELTFGESAPAPALAPSKPAPAKKPALSKRDQRNIDTLTSCHWLLCILSVAGSVVAMANNDDFIPIGFANLVGTLIYFKLGNAVIGIIGERLKK